MAPFPHVNTLEVIERHVGVEEGEFGCLLVLVPFGDPFFSCGGETHAFEAWIPFGDGESGFGESGETTDYDDGVYEEGERVKMQCDDGFGYERC